MTVWWVAGIGFVAGIIAIPAGVALHHFVIPVMAAHPHRDRTARRIAHTGARQ